MVSSLKNLCRVPGLVEILNHPHIKKEIFSLPINEYNYEERDDALQRVVSEFLKDYNLVIKENILKHFIIFIAFEMTKWAEYLKECFGFSFKFSEHFIKSYFFTSEGVLDEEKAARELLKEQSFSLFLKYNIACQYFLEDMIPGLWQELRNNEPNFKEWLQEHNPECPMVMWSDYLKEINSCSELNQKLLTPHFHERVFSYGLKNKNFAAVKFSYGPNGESMKTKEEVKIIRKLVDTTYCNFIRRTLKHIEFYEISTDYFFNREFVADRNIIMYFLSLMNKEELKEFCLKFDDSFHIISWFLLWPYQNQFMDLVHIIFENFGGEEYHTLMSNIISLFDDKYMCQFNNYRLLLREVWIKSPDHLKEQIIEPPESRSIRRSSTLLTMLFTQSNFTAQDLENVNLILKSTNVQSRIYFLNNFGSRICDHLIVSHGNFRLADLFLKTLDVDQRSLKYFQNFFFLPRKFDNMMKKQSINLLEEIFKWVEESDEIDNFKDFIFRWFSTHYNEHKFFIELEEEVPFCFLNKVAKWFLKTDENIKEWVNNIRYDPTWPYPHPKWFDRLLKYRGYSDEEASRIKREKMFGKLPQLARLFYFSINSLEVSNVGGILNLSLLKKEDLLQFTDNLRSFYEDSIKQKICLFCLNNNLVHGNGEEEELNCELHETCGFITFDSIDKICSSVNKIDYLIQKHEWRLKSGKLL